MNKETKEFVPDYVQIPKQVAFCDEIQPLDKIVYGIIYWFEHLKEGKCTASNARIARICKSTPLSIANSLNRLEEGRFIHRVFKDESRRKRIKIKCLIVHKRVSSTDDTSNSDRDSSGSDTRVSSVSEQREISPIRETNYLIHSDGVAEDGIPKVIHLFKDISPNTYQKWYGNITQRTSAANLFKRFPLEKLEILITQILPKLNVMPFIGKDCRAFSPWELEKNLDKIITKIKELKIKESETRVFIVK